jgi:hypothetical protein
MVMNSEQDILADWKTNRFIVVGEELLDRDERLIVLTDLKYWSEHVDELADWCNHNNMSTEGMTVVCGSDAEITAFMLRWA